MQQRYGVTADRVRLSLDADATQSGIEAGLDWLAQNAGANDRVYIFYSGHGNTGPDDNGDEDDGIDEFICAYDDNVRDDDFGQWTKRIKCSNVVTFIDTCFSGGAGRGIKSISDGARTMQRRPTDGFEQMEWRAAVRKRTRELAPEGFTMFAASRPEQPSQESAQLQQGVFTHFLRKGLEGEADANRDGHLTLRELFDYTRREVARFTGNEQQPALLPDNAELTIAP